MPQYDYDLFVIGGGSGGVRAARVAAALGKRVAIAEEYRFGGTCVIRGCVPKKLLVYASQFSEHFEDAAGYGWTVPEPSFDWPTLIANKDKEIARLERLYQTGVEKAGGDDDPFARRAGRPPHDPHRGREPHRHRRPDPDRHRRPAQPASGAARPRALHHLQRGLRSAGAAEGDRRSPAAATSRSSSPTSSTGSASRRRSSIAAARSSRASTWTCAAVCTRRWRRRASASFATPCSSAIEKRADGRLDAASLRRRDARPSTRSCWRSAASPNTENLGLEAAGVETGKIGEISRRRLFADQRRQHLGDRRRHQPRAADAGRDPRGDVLRRDGVQGATRPSPTTTRSRPPCSRSRRSARSA